ncbi:ATP-binding protein [Mycetohabitans sp. B46]|uniref:ATP-binding protein n=1 Tax=Mycetohabitans sp. B46 TaxID=2772536 RepID=UPI00307DED98
MRRPFDSLFGRLALLVVGVLLLAHFAWFALIRLQRSEWQARYAVEEAMFLIEAVRQHVERTPEQPLPSRVKVVPDNPGVAPAADPHVPPPVEHFLSELEDRLPPGTQIRAKGGNKPSSLWVREPGFKRWIVVPLQPLRSPRRALDRTLMWLGLIFTGAVLSALFAAWQLQRPLRTLAQAVARFGRGLPVAPVRECGPLELRQLTRGFNTMVSNLAQTDKDRNVMLAGVAHDLRTPLARLRLRAEMLDDAKARDGVVRDVDSMTHIVDQFLVFAHDGIDRSEPVGVDQQCDRIARTYRAVSPSADAVHTDLRAGPDFVLPAATLERVLSNLLDNAYAYGAPPVVIETVRTARGFTLTVSDQGGGILPQDLLNASRPFVRLDPARGGNGHSGLGLAIVERLTNRLGGECRLGNHERGGLRVELAFPAQSGTAQA